MKMVVLILSVLKNRSFATSKNDRDKIISGAKPGHGGILPKAKITDDIARIRHVSKDRDCISPAVNPECTTPKELLAFVQQLRKLSGGKPVGFKLCR